MAHPSRSDFPIPRGHPAPRTRVALVDRLALERIILSKDNLSSDAISIIQVARGPSTVRIYNASWRAFAQWCASNRIDPTSATIPDALQFLQARLAKGLSPSTLWHQVAALATVLMDRNLFLRTEILSLSCMVLPTYIHLPFTVTLHGMLLLCCKLSLQNLSSH